MATKLRNLPVLAVLAALVACESESPTVPSRPEPPPEASGALVCSADVRAGTVTCATPGLAAPAGASALIVGGQNTYITMASANVAVTADTFAFDATVKNLIPQAMGTADGSTPTATGVRVFFHAGPTCTAGGGTAAVANAAGTATFTASNQPYFQYSGAELGADQILSQNETSSAERWKIRFLSGCTAFSFRVYASTNVRYETGYVSISGTTSVTVGNTTTLTGTSKSAVGATLAGTTITWSSASTGVATVNSSTGVVTGVSGGTSVITASDGTRSGQVTVSVIAVQAVDDSLSQDVTGNVNVNTANTSPVFNVTSNDFTSAGTTITFAGWGTTSSVTQQGGNLTMTTSGADMGKFTYNPPAGYEGLDHFTYVITSGSQSDTATVALKVTGMIWFINNAASACTTRASGCGRISAPYSTLASFNAENNGTGNNPAVNDNVFVYESATAYPGPITLLGGQKLIGQDATATLQTITGITPITGSATLPSMNTGGNATTISGATGAVRLSSGNNTLRGFTASPSAGTGVYGGTFGTLTLGSDVSVDIATLLAGDTAVWLTGGTVSGSFKRVSANGANRVGSAGVVLSSITGTFGVAGTEGSAASGGTLTQMDGPGISATSTGALSLNWMTISSNRGSGISGSTVAGLTLRRSTVSGNGDAANEGGLVFSGLTGTVAIDTVTISSSYSRNVHIANSSGTLNLQADRVTLNGTNATAGAEGVLIERSGSAVMNVTIATSTFTSHKQEHFQFTGSGSGSGRLVLDTDTMTRGAVTATTGAVVLTTSSLTGSVEYDIKNNLIKGATGNAVVATLGSGTVSGTMSGYIRNNVIGSGSGTTTTAADSGSTGSSCMGVLTASGGTHTASVTGNTVRYCAYDGLTVDSDPGTNSTLNATVTGNTFQYLGEPPMQVESSATSATGQVICLNASTNNFADNDFAYGWDISVQYLTLRLPSYAGGATSATDVENYMNARNDGLDGYASLGAGATVAAASCPTPAF